jgi:ribosomal protein L15
MILNVGDISNNIEKWLKEDRAKKTSEGIEINLEGYKILSKGKVSEKLIITASSASENSKKKVEKAGGKILLK